MSRFLVPALPGLVLLLQNSLWEAFSRRPRALLLRGVAVVCVLSAVLSWVGEVGVARSYTPARTELIALGRWFAAHSMEGDVIAVSSAGAIPYFSRRPAIDMLGLNSRQIGRYGKVDHSALPAHKRYDARFVLGQSPRFIVLNTISEQGQPLQTGTLVSNDDLLDESEFWRRYSRVRLRGLSTPVVFVRNDGVGELLRNGLVETVQVDPPISHPQR